MAESPNADTRKTYDQALAMLHDEQAVRAARLFAAGLEDARLSGARLRDWGTSGVRRCQEADIPPVLLAMLPLLWRALLRESGLRIETETGMP